MLGTFSQRVADAVGRTVQYYANEGYKTCASLVGLFCNFDCGRFLFVTFKFQVLL